MNNIQTRSVCNHQRRAASMFTPKLVQKAIRTDTRARQGWVFGKNRVWLVLVAALAMSACNLSARDSVEGFCAASGSCEVD